MTGPNPTYASFAETAEEARDGLSVRQAFIRLLVLVLQDNEPAEVEIVWRTLARLPSPFTADALDVLNDIIAEPPPDLLELIRSHGWVSGPSTQSEAVAWVAQLRHRLQAIHDAEHPPPPVAIPEP